MLVPLGCSGWLTPQLAIICIIRVQPDPVLQLLRGRAKELIHLAALLEHCKGWRHLDALQSILHVVHLGHHIPVLWMLQHTMASAKTPGW